MVRRLLYLNGLAIINVILFHASGMGFVAMLAWGQRYLPPGVSPMSQIGSLPYYGLRVFEQVVVFSIPAFLMVSGYFVAVATGRSQATVGWKLVFSRVTYLVIPYLIWSGVVIVFKVFGEGFQLTPLGLARMLLTGSTNEVFYFVPLLIQFYLLSPLLVPLARKHWKTLLAVTAALQLVYLVLPYPLFLGMPGDLSQQLLKTAPKWFFLSRIFWFPLGIVVGFHLAEFKRLLYRLRWWLVGAALVLIPLGIIEWEIYFRLSGVEWLEHRETLLDAVYSIAVVFGLLAFDKVNSPFFNAISGLGSKSYGIYLIHGIVIEYFAKVLYHFAPGVLAYQIILQPAFIVLGLAVPLGLMKIVDKSPARKYYTILFG